MRGAGLRPRAGLGQVDVQVAEDGAPDVTGVERLSLHRDVHDPKLRIVEMGGQPLA
jgi:hypothetical protein